MFKAITSIFNHWRSEGLSSFAIKTLAAYIVVITFLCILTLPDPIQFKGTVISTLNKAPGCEFRKISEVDRDSVGAVVSNNSSCQTNEFQIKGPVALIQVAIGGERIERENFYLELASKDRSCVQRKRVFIKSPGVWANQSFALSDACKSNFDVTAPYSLHIWGPKTSKKILVQVRDRFEFVDRVPIAGGSRFGTLFGSTLIPIILRVLVLSCSLLLVFSTTNYLYFFILLCNVLLFQFSKLPYFYLDDWSILINLGNFEPKVLPFGVHNDHFIPLFFLLFGIEKWLFGSHYELFLVVSSLLLSVFAIVLKNFLTALDFKKSTSRILALLFCVSSLNSQVSQWAIVQAAVASALFGIGGITLVLKNDDVLSRKFIFGLIALGIAPLFFSAGVLYGPIGAIFIVLTKLFDRGVGRSFLTSLRFAAASLVCLPSIVVFVISRGVNNTLAVNTSLGQVGLNNLIKFVSQGAGMHAIIRPLAVFAFLKNNSVAGLVRVFEPINYFNFSFDQVVNLIFVFTYGTIGVLIFYFGKYVFSRTQLWRYYVLGFLYVVIFYFFIGIGRSQNGAFLSIATRYQFLSVPGLLILIAPIIQGIGFLASSRVICSLVASSLLGLWVYIQITSLAVPTIYEWQGDFARVFVTSAISESKNPILDSSKLGHSPALKSRSLSRNQTAHKLGKIF